MIFSWIKSFFSQKQPMTLIDIIESFKDGIWQNKNDKGERITRLFTTNLMLLNTEIEQYPEFMVNICYNKGDQRFIDNMEAFLCFCEHLDDNVNWSDKMPQEYINLFKLLQFKISYSDNQYFAFVETDDPSHIELIYTRKDDMSYAIKLSKKDPLTPDDHFMRAIALFMTFDMDMPDELKIQDTWERYGYNSIQEGKDALMKFDDVIVEDLAGELIAKTSRLSSEHLRNTCDKYKKYIKELIATENVVSSSLPQV